MWEPGARVLDGRFRVDATLGVGTATEAYLAEQLSLARKVVLKVIRPDLGLGQGGGERFAREVKRLAAVEHPSVVRVIDSGQVGELLYLVTEYVDGRPLAQELTSEPMLPERAVELLTQLAEALAAVHEQGLVHGELRPECVTLVKVTKGEQVKLADFGIARLVDAEKPEERVTLAVRAIGPLDYAAPEVVKGLLPDAASDVYAFGALAYRVLSGALPGKEPKPLAQAAPHLADEFKLGELVNKCLAVDAASRPAASELAKKLAALPRPSEPTLWMESMQRPPELPPKPAPEPPPLPTVQVPVAETPKPPEPLMPSIPMPTVSPTSTGIDPVLMQLGKPPPPQTASLSGGPSLAPVLVLGVVMVSLTGWFMFGRSTPAREARRLVEMKQPLQAIEIANRELKKGGTQPELVAIKAAAQHLSGAHQDEEATFRNLAAAPEALDPLVLGGLAEDFGRSEAASVQSLLRGLPAKELQEALVGFAQEPLSARQWGALRYLDLEKATQGLDLVALYSASLESSTCAVRKTAAKRLAQLDDDSAEGALLRLRELPREGDAKSCGQDEAAAAIQALKKSK